MCFALTAGPGRPGTCVLRPRTYTSSSVSRLQTASCSSSLLLICSDSLIIPRGVNLVSALDAVTFPPAWNLSSHAFMVIFVAMLLKLFYVATVSLWLVGLKL